MKRALIVCGMVMAFAVGSLSARSVNAVQQNGVFNAASTQPRPPAQVLLKVDLPPPGDTNSDQFFMLILMTRADKLAENYYGFFDKAAAIRLRDALSTALAPAVAGCCDMTPPPVASSMSIVPAATPGAFISAGPAFSKSAKTPKRPKEVPKDAVYLGISGESHHWQWKDKQGVNHIQAAPVNPEPQATPKK